MKNYQLGMTIFFVVLLKIESQLTNLHPRKKGSDIWATKIKITARFSEFSKLDDELPLKRRYLVLVNPASGKGLAAKIAREQLLPIMAEAEIEHELVTTTHPGHAEEISKGLKIGEYTGIAVVSGDGLFHEVVNGIMKREDAEQAAKQICLVPIPGGSGNALAASIVYTVLGIHNDPNLLQKMLIIFANGTPTPGTILRWKIGSDRETEERFSFLCGMWGIAADIDFESEKYRSSLGSNRFIAMALQRIVSLRKYDGSLEYRDEATGELKLTEGPITGVIFTTGTHFNYDSAARTNRALQEFNDKGQPLMTLLVLKSTSKATITKFLLGLSDLKTVANLEKEIPEVQRIKTDFLKMIPKS